jgi:uncharacterized membrane protein YfcA
MEISTIIILTIIGLAAGVLSGLVGLGGGLVIIPALVMALGMSQKAAQGTSVAIMLPPIGILAAWNYYKAGFVDIRYALIIAAAFILGGWFGSKAAIALPELVVRRIFAGIMIVTAIKMIFSK